VQVDAMSAEEFARYARDLSIAALRLAGEGELAAAIIGRGALASAKRRAPVLTGGLRRDIRLTRKGEVSIVEARDVASVFQEFGTSRHQPQPFIRPTVEEWEPRLVQEVEKVRDRAVRDL
jgi:HK97 gp10 family phage protein